MSRCTLHTAHTLLCDKPLPSVFLLADLPVAYSLYALGFQNLIVIFHDLGTIVSSVVKALYQTIDNIWKTCSPFFLLLTAQSCNSTALLFQCLDIFFVNRIDILGLIVQIALANLGNDILYILRQVVPGIHIDSNCIERNYVEVCIQIIRRHLIYL